MKGIIQYELHRKDVLNQIHDKKKLKKIDIITLFYINEMNATKIYVRRLRKLMYNTSSSVIASSLKNLESLGYFKKKRDVQDERKIILFDIDLEAIRDTLDFIEETLDEKDLKF